MKKVRNNDLAVLMKKKGYTPIKLVKSSSGHLELLVKLNGKQGKFLLDTGAGGTVVGEKKQKKYKLKTSVKSQNAVGAGGTIDMKISTVKKLSIGKYKIDALKIYIINLDHVNNEFIKLGIDEVDGVIGEDILTKGKAVIDYSNLKLYLKK